MSMQFQVEYRINSGIWKKVENTSEIILMASSYIPDSGTATTTSTFESPVGLALSDFEAGRVSDDINPTSFTLTEGAFTEVEFNLKAISGLVIGDIVEFRITNAGSEFLDYAVTPSITMTSGSAKLFSLFLTAVQPTRVIQ